MKYSLSSRALQIRALRATLIGIIVVVILAVSVNYLLIWQRRAKMVRQAASLLSTEMLRSADSIEYSEHQNGKARFRVRARKLLETRQGVNHLEEIDAHDFNLDGTVRNHIRSKFALYDSNRKRVTFEGDVRIDLGNGVQVRTASLQYDLNSNFGQTSERIELKSDLAFGTARGVAFDYKSKCLELRSDVDLTLKREVRKEEGLKQLQTAHATAARATYADSAQNLRFTGKAKIETGTEILSGEVIEASFSEDRKRLNSLFCDGDASYDSKGEMETRTLRGDRIRFSIDAESGTPQSIDVQGNGRFLSQGKEAGQSMRATRIRLDLDSANGHPKLMQSRSQVRFEIEREGVRSAVSGENLDAIFTPNTEQLEQVRVWGGAHMQSKTKSAASEDDLQAEEIRLFFRALEGKNTLRELQAEKTVRWTTQGQTQKPEAKNRVVQTLQAGVLILTYAQTSDSMESGAASRGVVMTGVPLGSKEQSEIRELKADSVHFDFFPGDNKLKGFEGEGNVSVIYHKPPDDSAKTPDQDFATQSRSIQASFSAKDGTVESISQSGDFQYRDSARTARAGRSDYRTDSEVFSLRDKPQISDESGTTSGESVEYDRKKKILRVHRNVRSVLRPKAEESKGSLFASPGGSPSPTVVTSEEMEFWSDPSRAVYSGRVQLLSESSQLQAESLEVQQGGERVVARNGVRHTLLQNQVSPDNRGKRVDQTNLASKKNGKSRPSSHSRVQSDELAYLKSANSVRYTGNVTMESGATVISTENLEAELDSEGKRVKHATASGKVNILQEGRKARGDLVDYSLEPERFVLRGNPAEVIDLKRGRSTARQLTFFSADARILFGNP